MLDLSRLQGNPQEADKLCQLLQDEIVRRKEARLIDFYEPLEQQLPFHRSLSQFRFWSTTNRAGKTAAGACETVWHMEGKHPFRDVPPPPVQVWIVTQTRDQASTVDGATYAEFAKWSPKDQFDPNNGVGKLAFTRNEIPDYVRYENGSIARFLSQEQGRKVFQSAQKVGIWWDEDIDDKLCFYEARARFGKYPVNMWITATPLSHKAAWMDELFEEKSKTEPKRYWFSTGGSYRSNVYLSSTEIESFERDIENDPYKSARTTGKRTPIGGLVFPEFDESIYVMQNRPSEEYLRGCTIRRGLDWAGAHGQTGCIWIATDREGYVTVFREYQQAGTCDTHIKNIVDRSVLEGCNMRVLCTICDWPTLGDIHGFNVRTEFARGGVWSKADDKRDYRIPTILADKDVWGGIESIRKLFSLRDSYKKPMFRISPACPLFISQLRHYSLHEANSVHEKVEVIKRNDHLLDPFRYCNKRGLTYVNPELYSPTKPYVAVPLTLTGMPMR